MANRGLNDAEVNKQLEQMVKFITSEAEEKAQELRSKAAEEFSIEKAKIVQAEKRKIMQEFERKEKQVAVQKKIAYSNELNQSRLKVLKARDDSVNSVVAEARGKLKDLGQPGEPYKKLLRDLIVQGLIKLSEPEVQVRCRKQDLDMVKQVLNQALKEYEAKTGKSCQLTVDSSRFLPASPDTAGSGEPTCAGGVVLSVNDDKILCNNTLDARINLAFEQKLPEIRTELFGRSLTRTHMN